MYTRTPLTRTLKGNEKQFELARVRVIGVDWKKKNKKQFAVLQLHFQSREREFSPSLREIRVIRVRVNRVKNDWKLSGV